MGQLLLFSLYNFGSFFSYVGRINVTNHFSLLFIDGYILAIQQIISHKEHLRYCFWSLEIFWTSLETLAPWSWQNKLLNTASKSFLLSNSQQKSSFFAVLMYALYGHPRHYKFKQKINRVAHISRLSFRFLWLCLNTLNTYPGWIHTNISSEMNLKFGEYWEMSNKRFVKTLSKIRKLSKN